MRRVVIAVVASMFVGVWGVGAAPVVQGHVQFVGGLPVAGAHVVLFDLSDLRRGVVAAAITDQSGQFALSFAGLRSARSVPFALGQSYPNPFNPAATIPYELTALAHVRLEIFNLLGQPVATLLDGAQAAGVYRAFWDGTDGAGRAMAAGVYIYRLTVDGVQKTGRMTLVDGQAGVPGAGASVQAVETSVSRGSYGLVVSGPGLVAYADAAFRVDGGLGSVVIEVVAVGGAKVVQEDGEGLLGDVDNDGQVTLIDALLVAMYIANPSSVLPNGGDMARGDVNGDGVIDLIDAWHIATYAADPLSPSLPPAFVAALDATPSFGDATIDSLVLEAGVALDALELPLASGGNGELTYRLDGALPIGLTFDSASRTLSGTPPADVLYAVEGYTLTYRVSDVDGDSAELGFTISVNGLPSFGGQIVANQTVTAGSSIYWVLPPISRSSGGNGELTYFLDGELPPGLTFDAASRTLSGTPPADVLYAVEGYALTYRVADVDGDSAELGFTISVNGLPSFGGQVVVNQLYTAGDGVSVGLPAAVGGNEALTYSLDGDLPPGLVFDAATRTLSGALPADAWYAVGYALTYRVSDVDGDSAALGFTISVNSLPSFGDQMVADQMYTAGDGVSLNLPAAAGGNGELTYSLDGDLPPGLVFDAETRTLSGTPTAAEQYEHALTYRVSDADGDSAALRFFAQVDRLIATFSLEGKEMSMEFVWIAPGVFQMGSPDSEPGRSSDETLHEVEISQGFYMGTYEITQGQWEAVMGTTPWVGKSYVRENPSHPAMSISWYDVHAFMGRLNDASGDSLYRLPSEAEWEYACRAGTTTRWSFGDEVADLAAYAWYSANAKDAGEEYAHAVGTRRPNAWGLYDMHGNLREWVQDWYAGNYYDVSPRVDPPGPLSGSKRVFRGGDFRMGAVEMRSARRFDYRPDHRGWDYGARLVRFR